MLLAALVLSAASGCAASLPRYRDEAVLHGLVVGEPKAAVLAALDAHDVDPTGRTVRVAPLRVRVSRRTAAGELLEIGEVPLIGGVERQVSDYWVLFRNGRLAMWGRAADWAIVKRSVPLRFEPSRADEGG